MDLKLTGRQVWLLNAMIREPMRYLPFGEAGMTNPQTGAALPFKAGPKDRGKIITLQKWVEGLMEKDKTKKDQYIFPKDDDIIETRLSKSYVAYLRDMVVYYERVGSLVQWCELYEQTILVLDGKEIDYGIDSVEEAMGPKVEKETAKIADKEKDKTATA